MDVSYNKFFKILIDRKMKKKDICELAGIGTSTMAKMARMKTYPWMFWSEYVGYLIVRWMTS